LERNIMTAHVLISGTLFREPEQRTSTSGKPFVTATTRTKDGEASQWWHLVAFSETAQAELMRLTDGDALSVQGALKAETYEKEGVTKLSLSVVADHVLALRQPGRKKADSGQRVPVRQAEPLFDDGIPF
jgi:single-stranded DNA-binding protein